MVGHTDCHPTVNLDRAAVVILEDSNTVDALCRDIVKGIPSGGVSALDEAIALGLVTSGILDTYDWAGSLAQ